MSRAVAVSSGKGGTGKSSVTVNLAQSLAALGKTVCVLDADLGLSNVDVLLDLKPAYTLDEVLFSGISIKSALVKAGPRFWVLCGASGAARTADLGPGGRKRLLDQIGLLDAFDFVLIDCSPGVHRQAAALCLAARELLVVVNPEPTSIVDAYALVKVLKERGLVVPPWFVVNKSRSPQTAQEVFRRLAEACRKRLNLPIRRLGVVPHDAAMTEAALARRALVAHRPESPAADAFFVLAQNLIDAAPTVAQGPRQAADLFDKALLELTLEAAGKKTSGDPMQDAKAELLVHIDQALDVLVRTFSREKNLPPDMIEAVRALKRLKPILDGTGPEATPAPPGDPAAEPSRSRPRPVAPHPPAQTLRPEQRRQVWLVCADERWSAVLAEMAGLVGVDLLRFNAPDLKLSGDHRPLVLYWDGRTAPPTPPADRPWLLIDVRPGAAKRPLPPPLLIGRAKGAVLAAPFPPAEFQSRLLALFDAKERAAAAPAQRLAP